MFNAERSVGIMIVDRKGSIRKHNKVQQFIFGLPEDCPSILGKNLSDPDLKAVTLPYQEILEKIATDKAFLLKDCITGSSFPFLLME